MIAERYAGRVDKHPITTSDRAAISAGDRAIAARPRNGSSASSRMSKTTVSARRDFTLALNLTGAGGDDPDIRFYENHVRGAGRNFSGYRNPAIDALVDRQSVETDFTRRRQMVREIGRRPQEDYARPIIFHARSATVGEEPDDHARQHACTPDGGSFEDVWLDEAPAGAMP
jgi:ABC-type transport system substrate-binding protein